MYVYSDLPPAQRSQYYEIFLFFHGIAYLASQWPISCKNPSISHSCLLGRGYADNPRSTPRFGHSFNSTKSSYNAGLELFYESQILMNCLSVAHLSLFSFLLFALHDPALRFVDPPILQVQRRFLFSSGGKKNLFIFFSFFIFFSNITWKFYFLFQIKVYKSLKNQHDRLAQIKSNGIDNWWKSFSAESRPTSFEDY